MELSIDLYFIGLSVIAGAIIFFNKDTPLYIKVFVLFLLYTLISEITATYLVAQGEHTTTLYNIYGVVQFIFYFYLLSNFIQNKKAEKIGRAIQLFYLILAVINLLFFQKSINYNTITYSIGCLIIVGFSVYYFYEVFKQKKVVNLLLETPFWVSTGLLFFFSCSFPLIATANIIKNSTGPIISNLHSILLLMNILLYSLFTIAFLCRIKIRKST